MPFPLTLKGSCSQNTAKGACWWIILVDSALGCCRLGIEITTTKEKVFFRFEYLGETMMRFYFI